MDSINFMKVPSVRFEEYDPQIPALHEPECLDQFHINAEDFVSYQKAMDSSVAADIESLLGCTDEIPNISCEMIGKSNNVPYSSHLVTSVCTKPPVSRLASAKRITPPTPKEHIAMDRSTCKGKAQQQTSNDYSSSDEECPVESPVRGTFRKPSPLAKRKRPSEGNKGKDGRLSQSSSSSSTSSRVDEPSQSQSKRIKKDNKNTKEVDGHKRVKPKSHMRQENDVQSERSRSCSKSAKSAVVQDKDIQKTSKHPQHYSKTSISKRLPAASRTLKKDLLPRNEPLDNVIQQDNLVFPNIRNKQRLPPRRKQVECASCDTSSVTICSPKDNTQPASIGKLSVTYLYTCLREGVRENVLAKKSVINLLNSNVKSRVKEQPVLDMVRNIYTVRQIEEAEPKIWNNDNYLFCSFNNTFGYDQEALNANKTNLNRSLARALRLTCNEGEHSLDMVFRRSLKEISDEMYTLDTKSWITIENPIWISGQYLELRLLQKIRDYYKIHLNGNDISDYLTQCSVDTESPFNEIVHNNASEEYIKTLHDRYKIRTDSLDELLKNFMFMPTKLRVWTDIETQTNTNAALLNILKVVYDENLPITNKGIAEIIDVYVTAIRDFISANLDFISEVCKASELFAWMCLGVVTDHVENGTMYIAAFYDLVKRDIDKTTICWNYPLASMYNREVQLTAMERKMEKEELIQTILTIYNRHRKDNQPVTNS